MSDFRIRCVKVFGHHETQKLIEDAFEALKQQKLSPVWFSEDECFTVKEKRKNEVYIFDVFSGDAFEHIASHGSRVLGPMCVITSLACQKDIPKRQKPVYNLAMKDLIVCCTNLDKARRDLILERVELMGGEIARDLTEQVTHLVAGTVGSQKYHVAGSINTPIMLPKWVDEVWEKSKLEAVHGIDEQFHEYKCPIFYGQVITVSGLSSSERTEAKRLIEKEGGVYSGEMKAKECTHLIINEAKGQKYNFALRWNIHVVRSEWLYESIEKGYCQDEKQFPVEQSAEGTGQKMKTSTPERRSMAAGDITDINNISMISMANVNETAMNNVTNLTRIDDPTENLDVTKAPEDLFLDGCKIYLSGFRGAALEKLRKIINSGGGSRFNQISDNLTHVVVGEKVNTDIERIKALTNRPHIVTSQWLVDCFKQEKHLDETPYFSTEVAQPAPKTPEVKSVRKKSQAPKNEPQSSTSGDDLKHDDDMADIMSQYLDNPQHNKSNESQSNDTTVAPVVEDNDLTQDPNNTSVKEEGAIYTGKTFVFYGFNEENISVLSSYIKENGGTVLQGNARKIPDYAIVPIDGFPVDRTVKDIATYVWLQICIEQDKLLDLQMNPLFTPIELNVETQPLQDCVLSVSGYLGTERDCLVNIAEVLGAKMQDYFVRQAKKDLLPSTHLLVNATEGSKYQAAKKWGLPAVSKLWILACAKTGRKLNEETFLIEKIPDDNASFDNLIENLETQAGDKSLNQSKIDNTSRKSVNQSKTEDQSRKSLTEKQSDQINAEMDVDEQANNMNTSLHQNATGKNESGFRDFSTMGDTEALLAGLNTQREQNTICDKNRTLSTSDDEVYIKKVDVKDAAEVVENEAENNSDKGSEYAECAKEKKSESGKTAQIDEDMVEQNGDIEDDDDDEVVIINKNVKKVEKKPETPALTRFMKKLDKDAPKAGTPLLTDKSVREKLLGKGAQGWRTMERKRRQEEQTGEQPEPSVHKVIRQENDIASVDTPPLARFMRKLDKDPPKPGTPLLTEMSAREKLLGKGYQGWRTIERKKKQQEQQHSQSQKENLQTPVQNRLKELKSEAGGTTDKDTPSKFLDPNVRYYPKFQTEELLKALETPDNERSTRARKRKQSLDDDELFEWAVNKATKKLADLHKARLEGNLPASQSASDEPDGDYEEPSTVLQGVVITVGKKLTKDQDELHTLVSSLGGDYRWTFDKSCTHFIFQGRQNDTSKEFKQAKASGMKIVSPHWLYMCKEQNARVEESLFPHTFNPNLSLSVVSTRRTPMRTPRSSRRTARAAGKADNPPPIQPIVISAEDDENSSKESKPVSPVVEKSKPDLISPEKGSSDEDKKVADSEAGGSLEMREVLSKQLEDVMSKGRKRRKSKKLNNSGQVGTPEESLTSSSKQGRRTQENIHRNSSSRSLRSMADEEAEDKNHADVGPSQPVHVSWDDPMSRLEQAKLAHKLERANSPTQEVGGMYDIDPDGAQYSEDEEEEVPVPAFGAHQQVQEGTTPKSTSDVSKKTPTPEGPSLAFPTSKKSSEVTPPKPLEIEDEDAHEDIVDKPPPVFIMSGMSTAERDDYGALVEQLGGKVLDTQTYDNSCTHLVINNVTRNEKFLASLASGKWVLHKSYFEACRQEQRFVEEDFYEWGSEGTLSLVKNMESNVRLLAIAARDWRVKIQEEKLRSSNYGAFCKWRVLLNCDRSRECNYRRLLVAGGATVLNIKPPYPAKIDATHALLELHKVPLAQEEMEKLLANDCLCLKIDYISGYLCNPKVDVADYTPPEIAALQTVMHETTENTGKKRKASSSSITPKRSKRR